MYMDIARAPENLAALKANTYPGRIVMTGLDETGKYVVQACALMGRSDNSRNRVYKQEGGRVYTDLAKPDPNADTELTIYNAMGEQGNYFVASNGHQTDAILTGFIREEPLCDVLDHWQYEPEKSDYTPRISAVTVLGPQSSLCMSILRKAPDSMACERTSKVVRLSDLPPGVALCLQTYEGNGKPLPAYRGEPYSLPLYGCMEPLADRLWETLNADNRVGLALKFIERETGKSALTLRNKHLGD